MYKRPTEHAVDSTEAKKTGGIQPSPAGARASPGPDRPQQTGLSHSGSPVTDRYRPVGLVVRGALLA